MSKDEIIEYLYEHNVRGDLTIEQMAEDLADRKDEPPMDCKGCKHWKGGCDIEFPICKRDPVEDEPQMERSTQ